MKEERSTVWNKALEDYSNRCTIALLSDLLLADNLRQLTEVENELFTCIICHCFLQDPVKCSNCHIFLCGDKCSNDIINSSNLCPQCRQSFEKAKFTPFELSSYMSVKVRGCAHECCPEKFKAKTFQSARVHMTEECNFRPFYCPN